jgi:hypothetical protein
MIIMPSMNDDSSFGVGPRDLIHSLSQVLASFRGGNPAVISILQDKLTTLGLAVGSPQKLLELSSPEDETDEWQGERASSHSSAFSGPDSSGFSAPVSPAFAPSVGGQAPYP